MLYLNTYSRRYYDYRKFPELWHQNCIEKP